MLRERERERERQRQRQKERERDREKMSQQKGNKYAIIKQAYSFGCSRELLLYWQRCRFGKFFLQMLYDAVLIV